MPPANFHPLTRAQFEELFGRFPFQRKIESVHMHHTFIPTHADYRGLQTIVNMWEFHTRQQGWSDIAQHVSIAPDGTIWTGRNWNQAPASAKGFNGSSAAGPFMFETIGNFDAGHDRLEGEQLQSVIAVIGLVSERFDLTAAGLRFHKEMTNEKTCPGTGVNKDEILRLVTEFRAKRPASRTIAAGRAPTLRVPADPRAGDALIALIERPSVAGARSANPGDELPEGGMTLEERRVARGEPVDGIRALTRGGLSPAEIAALQPHLVNLNGGELSSGGTVQTTVANIDAIFGEHIPKFFAHPDRRDLATREIVFFAHGGLVGELSGLGVAHKGVEWWKANNVYPIYFVWETGLCESLGKIFRDALGLEAAAERGIIDSIKNAVGKVKDFVVDHITDNAIAEACHLVGGVGVWEVMKSGGRNASGPRGGGRIVAERLAQFLRAEGDAAQRYRLHAVGHSAGTIFHAHFVPLVQSRTQRTFASVQFLAPAIRVDEFKDTLWPLVRAKNGAADARVAAEKLTIYTMRDALERADNCGPYRKSLLYLIHDGLEPRRDEPILGLERSMEEDDELAADLLSVTTRTRQVDLVFSPSPVGAPEDSRSRSDSHGGFDDDPDTMDSVVRRVLGRADGEITHYKTRNEDGGDIFTSFKNCLQDFVKTRDLGCPPPPVSPCGCGGHGVPAPPAPISFTAAAAAAVPAGRRRALCIGIDRYPTAPLAGCVNDARSWSTALTTLGFTTKLLIEPTLTTRSGILAAVDELIAGTRSGDVVVIQYAGHGTQVPDRNRDETEDAFDQALCPIDFASGRLLIDDDVAAAFAKLPAGVNLTCFFDCCHSGSITRFAVGDTQESLPTGDRRARFIKPTPQMIAAHDAFRASLDGERGARSTRAFSASRGPASMREVVFSACRRDEVAFENNGQGDFTRRAVPLLTRALQGTNADFKNAVIAAFGPAPSQHPLLDCAPASEKQPFLAGVSAPAAAPSREASSELSALATGSANTPLARVLRDIADLIDHG